MPREERILDSRPLPREERIPKNKSYSKLEAYSETKIDETYIEDETYSNPEVYSEGEVYSDHETYSEQEAYSDHETYSEGETYSNPEVYSEGEVYSDHETYSEQEAYSDHDPYLADEAYSEEKSYSRELVPYQQSQPPALMPSPSTALEPYQISTAMEEYLPKSLLPDLSAFIEEDKAARPKPWETDKLPWGLPKRDPDIEGTIIQIQQSQELPDYPNLVVGLVNMLTELIWIIPNDTMKKEEERLQITTVRIRTSNDEKKDARLIGYLRGANLTLGDDIWFWGWHRQGSLTVRKGYNWTSKAIVNTHSMGLVIPALLLLILTGIGFLLFLAGPSIAAGFHVLQ